MTEIPMGYREGVRQYALGLEGVRVPESAVVGQPGEGLLAMWLSRSGPVSNEFAKNFIAQHVLGLPTHK